MKKFSYLFLIAYSLQLTAFLSGCATVPKTTPLAISPALQDEIISVDNTNYVPLLTICERFNYKWSWDTVDRKADVYAGVVYARFAEGSSFALVNNNIKRMEAPAVLHKGALLLPVSFAQTWLLPPSEKSEVYPIERPRVAVAGKYLLNKIVIDAGHGGKDPGAIGRRGLKEKEVTMDIARRLKERLEKEGFTVFLSRSDDKFVTLARRPQIANEKEAHFFVSVHANAAKMKNARGFEVYYLAEAADDNAKRLAEEENASLKFEQASFKVKSKNSLEGILWDLVSTENRAESIQLANYISKQARKKLWVYQRGVKSAQFYVLKGARMPAVLAEVGFISNRDEEAKLSDPSYRDSVAQAIANGILDYRQEYQLTEGFTK